MGVAGAGADGAGVVPPGGAGGGVAALGAAGTGVAGADGAGTAGVAGLPVFENCCSTELPEDAPAVLWRIVIAIEVIMNMIAHHVVAFERKVAAPRGPKAV